MVFTQFLTVPVFQAVKQARIQPEFFLGEGKIMEGQNFFVYSDENEGIKCLYRYYTGILVITSRRAYL